MATEFFSARANTSTETPIDVCQCNAPSSPITPTFPHASEPRASPSPSVAFCWGPQSHPVQSCIQPTSPHPACVSKGHRGPRLSALGSPALPSSDRKRSPRKGKQWGSHPLPRLVSLCLLPDTSAFLPLPFPSSPKTHRPHLTEAREGHLEKCKVSGQGGARGRKGICW